MKTKLGVRNIKEYYTTSILNIPLNILGVHWKDFSHEFTYG
jgi:hypothetical protein